MLTPEQRTMRARIAANARWGRQSGAEQGRRGQAGLRAKYEREAREAEPGLTDQEYARRADCLLKAHMDRMTLAASKARSSSNLPERTSR